MMFRKVLLLFIVVISVYSSHAQDTLPGLAVENLGKNRIKIGWKNPFGAGLIQLNVQRSYDSLKNFRTIFSTPSPELPENGFIDPKAVGRTYYRIFYVLSGGAYYFTKAKRAAQGFEDSLLTQNIPTTTENITVKIRNEVYKVLNYEQFLHFKDSIVNQTMDSLFFLSDSSILIKPYVQQGNWVPSMYVFTNKDGYISVHIPDATQKKYKVFFFDESGK